MSLISRLYDFVAGTRIKSNEIDAEFNQLVSAYNSHDVTLQQKANKSDVYHRSQLYTKSELDPFLIGGDTVIYEDVFTIINSNNGDNTFTYSFLGSNIIGSLTPQGCPIFTLSHSYTPGNNSVSAIINDTLRRSVASGGIIEVSDTQIALTSPEGNGAEITVPYFNRIGIINGGFVVVSNTLPPNNSMWFKVVG